MHCENNSTVHDHYKERHTILDRDHNRGVVRVHRDGLGLLGGPGGGLPRRAAELIDMAKDQDREQAKNEIHPCYTTGGFYTFRFRFNLAADLRLTYITKHLPDGRPW